MSDDIDNETVLLLLGKTGLGKSSTGNTILGREDFEVSDDLISKTTGMSLGFTRRHGRVTKVVDGPGLFDTRLDEGEAAELMSRDLLGAFTLCPRGFDSLLLVMKYGHRFTQEELKTVTALKEIFGTDFVRNFCIILVTNGEVFDMESNKKYPGRTFQEWCQKQEGPFQTLYQECDKRVVLFHNLDPEKREANLQKLFLMVDQVKNRGRRYTNVIFQQAAATREQYIVKEKRSWLREEIQRNLDLLMEGVDRVRKHNGDDADLKQLLDQITTDAESLLEEIDKEDKETGVLKSMREIVIGIMREVAEIRAAENMQQALIAKVELLQTLSSDLEKNRRFFKNALIASGVLALGIIIFAASAPVVAGATVATELIAPAIAGAIAPAIIAPVMAQTATATSALVAVFATLRRTFL